MGSQRVMFFERRGEGPSDLEQDLTVIRRNLKAPPGVLQVDVSQGESGGISIIYGVEDKAVTTLFEEQAVGQMDAIRYRLVRSGPC